MDSGKQIACRIFQETVTALDIPSVMQRKLTLDRNSLLLENGGVSLPNQAELLVVAIGKAAHPMVAGLRGLLPEQYKFRGVVAAPTPPASPVNGLHYFVAGHPNPNEGSWRAAEAILAL